MAVALFKEPPLPRPALAFSGGFAFLSDDVSGVTAYDVMGECEQTECEAGCMLSVTPVWGGIGTGTGNGHRPCQDAENMAR